MLDPSFHIISTDSTPVEWPDCPEKAASETAISGDSMVSEAMVRGLFEAIAQRASSLRPLTLRSGDYLVQPSESNGRCARFDQGKWGDPRPGHVCSDYFPVVEVKGDLTLSGGVGQGVLIVHGGLRLAGGVRFLGAALVDGPLNVIDGTVFGGVLTSAKSEETTLRDGAIVYSSCALAKASLAMGRVDFLDERAWFTSH
jgi:hypothetical protein